ncbi:cadherin-87A-like [Biomphalaria glabrata]|uniref:Cadherin-87A-like n=1 Tax=Biomphalaria glabrata TaxID=6526 RepID=A0A9W2ZML9_BIOGL|nr:cadherin-87A-like [Biomphalaria glabrata]XP_055876322.1 cadherin-87A-like [Biomphalaria glabrata]
MQFIFIVLVSSFVVLAYGQRSVPVFLDYSALNGRFLSESQPKDSYIGQISATDPDGTSVNYFIDGQGGEYFAIDQKTGIVTLKKLLDYEISVEIKLTIRVVDGDGQTSSVEGKVFVNDANDNAPVFNDTAIFRSLPENTTVGSKVASIDVTDVDTNNAILNVSCVRATVSLIESCNTFGLNMTKNSNKYWNGDLILIKQLDYEEKISYIIQLLAFDGVFSVINEVHIEVSDINDTPPRWTLPGPKTIDEELPIGFVVQKVSAEDPDVNSKHDIYYELIGNNTDTFGINSTNGNIFVKKRIDYDDPNYQKEVPYDLTIKAREILDKNTLLLGNDSSTTSTITIRITVRDINDNGPVFNQNTYEAYIDENTIAGANVPVLQMTVTDIDSGTYNTFRLFLNDSTFGILPEIDSSFSTASMFVKSSNSIDYEKLQTYVLVVNASDTVAPFFSSSATVTIHVRDVNDITPTFSQLSYQTSISELTAMGSSIIKIVATDSEQGLFGTAGIVYSLFGNIPPHFAINPKSGDVTVASCNGNVGVGPECIDYERKKVYSLTVSATDNNGNGLTRSVPLVIYILDENDNVPKLETSYVRWIYEGQTVTINPLIINATDPDSVGGPLRYYIESDSSNLWQTPLLVDSTNHTYANITALRAVRYSDTINGAFNFVVRVRDAKNEVASPVTIYVIDVNNNAPVFISSSFIENIYENTKGDTFVITVTASDADSYTTGNGQIDISIQSGALGKFTVKNVALNNVTGFYTADIYTTPDAIFNYDNQKQYVMQLLARDRGTPSSKFGTSTLTINILDINNRDPRINPLSQSVTVSENTPIGTSVYTILAEDPDAGSRLKYYFTPEKANDGTGNVATSTVYDFRTMFRIDSDNGRIFVNSTLDRKSVARITYSVRVQDVAANPVQNGTGSFLIYILEYNDHAPRFDLPLYNISIDEEQNVNAFVVNLNCRDDEDKISGYTLTQTSPRLPQYFSLIPGSGAMIVSERIDFEKIETIELIATCTDNGQPNLSNTTRVLVNVININDNSPIFDQPIYRIYIYEGTYSGPLNLTVNAKDIDKGDYGVVRYEIPDKTVNFTINSTTGEIYFVPNSMFDRETNALVSFQVTAYDSPLNSAVRRNTTVAVYVYIMDVNDNCPEFSQKSYFGKVPESAGPGTNVLDLSVTDKDIDINGQFDLAIKPNSFIPAGAESLFALGSNRVIVANSLRTKAGNYSFYATATDKATTNRCTREVPVTIQVLVSLNDAPIWVKPPNRDFVISVLESQYDGMLVYGAKAVDNNTGPNGIVDYFFVVNQNELVSATPEFRINQVTGVIRAEIVYDRERRDSYFLTLMAKDRGTPSASSETTITVIILDVNDNDPVFPMKDGVVTPLVLPDAAYDIGENVVIPSGGLKLGTCNATDADSDTANNKIYYKILSDQVNILDYIHVNNATCDIYLIKKPDYETSPELYFNIYAYNEKNNDRVIRNKRDVDPSILPVIVRIKDSNDNPPVFTQSSYYECVTVDAPFNDNILEVSATDKDTGTTIVYGLSGTSAFTIDPDLGIISNVISFQGSNVPTSYSFKAVASDGLFNTTADITIVVASSSNLASMKVNRPLQDIEPFKQQIAKSITDSNSNKIKFACIVDMKSHVEDDGTLNAQVSDVLVAAVNPSTGQLYSAPDLVSIIQSDKNQANSVYNAIYVTDVKADQPKDGFSLKEDAVLAILIITILLIFLAILLFIIACLCIRRSKKKKTKQYQSKSLVYPPQPVEPSHNPVYVRDVQPEDMYTLPKKVPIHHVEETHMVVVPPVIVPAEEELVYPPPEPVRNYLNTEPEPFIETELEPFHVQHLPPPQPLEPEYEPEFEDKLVTEVIDDDLPAPILEGEIETEIRDSPASSALPSPAGSRKSNSS